MCVCVGVCVYVCDVCVCVCVCVGVCVCVCVCVCVRERERERERDLVSWRFEPSQPLGIISGLNETFIKRYIVEMTSKVEIRLEGQCEKMESCQENL